MAERRGFKLYLSILQAKYRTRLCIRHNRTDVITGKKLCISKRYWGNPSPESLSGGVVTFPELSDALRVQELEIDELREDDGQRMFYWACPFCADR